MLAFKEYENVDTGYSRKCLRRFIETRCKRPANRQACECLWFPTPLGLATTTNHTRRGIQSKWHNRIPFLGTYHRKCSSNRVGSPGQEDWSCRPIEPYTKWCCIVKTMMLQIYNIITNCHICTKLQHLA